MVLIRRGRDTGTVERVAIRRAAVSSVLEAVERGLKVLHPGQRKIYKMRYRAYMSYQDISRRLHVSEETVGRRLNEIRAVIARFLAEVPAADFDDFKKFSK